MAETKLGDILQRYGSGDCTEEERAIVEKWYFETQSEDGEALPAEELEVAVNRVQARLPVFKRTARVRTLWLRTAAASVALAICCCYFVVRHKQFENELNTKRLSEVSPGTSKALLTLGDGSQISLAGAKASQLNKIKGLHITKNASGQIVYAYAVNKGTAAIAEPTMNTISTQLGATYEIFLPDGSHAWLNAGSELRFPTAFSGNDRVVEIKGEVYFEVVHDAKMPFIVKAGNQKIEVLGTHFNVTDYSEDKLIKTTLLEGSVKVSSGTASTTITPGEQAQATDGKITIVKGIDLDEVVAWKNGNFKFNEPLKDIMQQIGRWYDVEIVFAPNTDQQQSFSGKITRSKDLSAVLRIMENSKNVHFKIEGRRITVMP